MLGIHVNWTAPFTTRNPGRQYEMDPFEVLTSIASALFWTRRGHKIVLYTDPTGLRFYESSGLAGVYHDLDIAVLDNFTRRCSVDPTRAPCLGRMHVMGSMTDPFVAMDLDFVLFSPGDFAYDGADLCCLHWELPVPPWYPPAGDQYLPAGFDLPANLDFAALVPNIAFLYVGKPTFFQGCAELAVDYVTKAVAQRNELAANKIAIFADQRLLGMLAHRDELVFETLLNDLWTCGPHGEHWHALSRQSGLGRRDRPRDLLAPFWVLDRRRFDIRKDSVECLHLWFEKPLYAKIDRHTPRRQAIIAGLLQRIEAELSDVRFAGCLVEWLMRTGHLAALRQR